LLTLCGDLTARIWEVATGKPAGEPLEHLQRPFSGSFSNDGLRVVTVTYDHTVQVWDVATGRRIAAPLRYASEPAVRTGGDQLLAVVVGSGGTWDLSRAAESSDSAIE